MSSNDVGITAVLLSPSPSLVSSLLMEENPSDIRDGPKSQRSLVLKFALIIFQFADIMTLTLFLGQMTGPGDSSRSGMH